MARAMDDERLAIERHLRELDRLAEDLTILAREIAESTRDEPATRRLLSITCVNLTVVVGLMAAIGDIARFRSPQTDGATSAILSGQLRPAHSLRAEKAIRLSPSVSSTMRRAVMFSRLPPKQVCP